MEEMNNKLNKNLADNGRTTEIANGDSEAFIPARNEMSVNSKEETVNDDSEAFFAVRGSKNEIGDTALLEAKILDMQQRIDELENDKNTIFSMYLKTIDDEKFCKMIRDEKDYAKWFRCLPEMVSRFLVIVTVRDTPGGSMPKNVYKNIIDAGFSNFRTELWNTYIGVYMKGKCWFNERRANEEKCSYTYESLDGKFRIDARSEPWRNGNRGEIFINGKQESKNTRGINIVVYDTEKNMVVDSVAFDSHESDNIRFSN